MRERAPDQPLWHQESNFDEKPTVSPYGYLLDGTAIACRSFDELRPALQECSELRKVLYVWTPDSPYYLLIGEVEGLLDILKPMRIESATEQLKSARQKALIGGVIAAAVGFTEIQRYGIHFHRSPMIGLIGIIFLMFALVPFYESWKKLRTARKLDQSTLDEQSDEIRFDLWTMKQPCYLTKVLLGILVLIATLQWIAPVFTPFKGFSDTIFNAGIIKEAIRGGEGWRLWSAPFLHGNHIHIFMNASGLWYLGKRVEVLTRWPNLLFCYLLSILASSYTSYFFIAEGRPSIGASGGIMGLLGFLLIFEILHPKLAPKPARRRLLGIIILMVVMGLAGYQFIDNAAHAGGLIAGLAYGFLGFRKSDTVRRPVLSASDRLLGYSAGAILLGAAIFTILKMYQLF